jgi:hypothetical protein
MPATSMCSGWIQGSLSSATLRSATKDGESSSIDMISRKAAAVVRRRGHLRARSVDGGADLQRTRLLRRHAPRLPPSCPRRRPPNPPASCTLVCRRPGRRSAHGGGGCAIGQGALPKTCSQQGAPAGTILYVIPRTEHPVCSKNFYKADKIDLTWNSRGTGVLVFTQTEVDKTGKSYYGESNLHVLGTDGKSATMQFGADPGSTADGRCVCRRTSARLRLVAVGCRVCLRAWADACQGWVCLPCSRPADIFNRAGEPIHSLGTGPHCHVRYSPSGTLLLLAGFGNLRCEVCAVADRQWADANLGPPHGQTGHYALRPRLDDVWLGPR